MTSPDVSILLDTDTAIALIRGWPESARRRFREVSVQGSELWLSSVTLFELWYGVSRSHHLADGTERLMDFVSGPLSIAEFTDLDAARAGTIRAELAGRGRPIGPYDVLIAAQAVRAGHLLVSGNEREFRRIDDLEVENWLS